MKHSPVGTTTVLPESYTCVAKLGAKQLAGSGTGGCTIAVPKKKARGKRLTVQLTVSYQGATKVVPLTFKVT
jgi:mevalonate kinase